MDKYEKLTEDLKKAAFVAKEFAYEIDDGGTCNFDSLMLVLFRYDKEKTLEAIRKAGLRAFKDSFWKSYIISPPIPAQGDMRTIQAEKMAECMKKFGYDATVYYQMD